MVAVGCGTVGTSPLHVTLPGGLGYLRTWQLGYKHEQPIGSGVTLSCFLFYDLRSHTASLLP